MIIIFVLLLIDLFSAVSLGIYNKETHRRDYYKKNPEDNLIKNYRIETIDIDISDYVNYIIPLNQIKAS